jgi:hypothetical protein
MDPQEYKIFQTAKAQGKDDAFIKGAILAYRQSKQQPTVSHGGISLQATARPGGLLPPAVGNFIGNAVSSFTQPFVSLAAVPVQAAAKALGQPDPYAQGFPQAIPGLGDQNINVTPLGLKQKVGDVLKAGAETAAVVAAPETLLGTTATGAGIGAGLGTGEALQQNAPAEEVAKKGLIGGTIGAITAGAASIFGKLLSKAGDKISTSVIRPTRSDLEDGFSLKTMDQYNLRGSLNSSLEKTQNAIAQKSQELYSKINASDSHINLDDVVNSTIKELTDESKLKGFGANAKVQNALQGLKDEVSIVGSDVSIPDAQVIKQASGSFGAWQYGKPDPESKATEIVYNTFYNKLKAAIENSSPEGVKEINRELSKLIPIQNAILRRLPVAERNNLISLSDMIGLVGSSHNPIALGPTILNIISKSGYTGKLLSQVGPKIGKTAIPVALGTSAIGQQVVPGSAQQQ